MPAPHSLGEPGGASDPNLSADDLDLGRAESDGAVDAASLLSRFDGVPSLEAFETANCMLGRALGGRPSPTFGRCRSGRVA